MTPTPDDLRRWREQRRYTQSQAAAWYGCSLRQWQRYEAGDTPLPVPLMNRLRASRR